MRALCLPVLVLAAALAEAHKPTTTKFTYHGDVYPIFAAKCGSCHQPGGVAPMSLLSYKQTYPWAVAIKNEVLGLAMPPWFADERYGEFQHAGGLTAGEVNTIVDWCLGGTPEGDPAEARPGQGKAAWTLGEPDAVLAMPAPFTIPAGVGEVVHEVTIPTGLRRDRLVRAFDFRPESPNVVRSALVFVSGKGPPAPKDLVASWIPGEERVAMPGGRGVRLRKKGSLTIRIHYKKTWLDEGKAVTDRSRLALYFHEKNKGKRVEPLVVAAGENGAIRPEGRGFETTLELPLSRSVEVLALLPRTGAPIAALHARAVLPQGDRLDLIRLVEPHPDWPRKFWLEAPVSLPRGSAIQLTLSALEEEALRAPHFLLLDVVPR